MITDKKMKQATEFIDNWNSIINTPEEKKLAKKMFEKGAKWMQEQSMRWVKSKERLPETNGYYWVKNFAGNPSTEFFNGKEVDWSAIEWLYEPPTTE